MPSQKASKLMRTHRAKLKTQVSLGNDLEVRLAGWQAAADETEIDASPEREKLDCH
jgi:hypothetical protein